VLPEESPANATATAGVGNPAQTQPATADVIVLRGEPTAEELAAVTVVIDALTAPTAPPVSGPPPRSLWSQRDRLVRPALRPGPGAWRANGLP
jgi:hypothetical protein